MIAEKLEVLPAYACIKLVRRVVSKCLW